MAASSSDFLLKILRACEQLQGAPLYPSDYAAQAGTDRDQLDQGLDQLRLADLVRLTDWIAGKGQGYALTEEGQAVVRQGGNLQQALHRPKPAPTRLELRELTPWERGEAVRDAFVRPTAPVVTLTLVLLNGLVFCAGVGLASYHQVDLNVYFSGSLGARLVPQMQQGHEGAGQMRGLGLVYHELGSLGPEDVLVQDQWWRLLTYSFVHGGFLHLLFNMISLFVLGPLVERMWGSWRFLTIYLISVAAGGCAALLHLRGVVGASGGVAGIMTSLVVWIVLNRHSLPPPLVNRVLGSMFGSFAMLIYFSFMPGVSWEGHLGGAVGGLLASFALHVQRFGRGWLRLVGMVGAALIPAAAVALIFFVQGDWRREMRLRVTFAQIEHRCFEAYQDHLKPLVATNFSIRNSKELESKFPNARAALEQAESEVNAVLDQFKKAKPLPEKEQNEAVQQARTYLQTWAELFSWAKAYCEEPGVHQVGVQQKHEELLSLLPAQRQNHLFPSTLMSEKEKKQGPKN